MEQAQRQRFWLEGRHLVLVLPSIVLQYRLGDKGRDDGRQRIHDDGLDATALHVGTQLMRNALGIVARDVYTVDIPGSAHETDKIVR